MYEMNSSVTLDSAISVISSLCLEMSASSRSNGPSNTSRCTSKSPPAGACGASPGSPITMVVIQSPSQPARRGNRRRSTRRYPMPGSGTARAHVRPAAPPAAVCRARGGSSCPLAQAPRDQASLALGIEVGQQDGECLAHDPAAVGRDTVGPQRQPGALQVHEFAAGQVDGDLLRMRPPAPGLAPGLGGGAARGLAEQLSDSRQAYPP